MVRRRPPRRSARLRRAAHRSTTCSRSRSRTTNSSARSGPSARRRAIIGATRIGTPRTARPTSSSADPSQRAMVHPVPTPTRCFMATASGRVMFDAGDRCRTGARRAAGGLSTLPRRPPRPQGTEPASAAPSELALHEEKTRVIAEWVAAHGIGGPARPARRRPAAPSTK